MCRFVGCQRKSVGELHLNNDVLLTSEISAAAVVLLTSKISAAAVVQMAAADV